MRPAILSLFAVAAFAVEQSSEYAYAPLEMGTAAQAGNAYQSGEFFGTYRLGMTDRDAPVQVLASVGSGFCRDDDSHALYMLGGLHGRWSGMVDFGSTMRIGRTDDSDLYLGLSGDATLWLIGSRDWKAGLATSVLTTSETSGPTWTGGILFTISPF